MLFIKLIYVLILFPFSFVFAEIDGLKTLNKNLTLPYALNHTSLSHGKGGSFTYETEEDLIFQALVNATVDPNIRDNMDSYMTHEQIMLISFTIINTFFTFLITQMPGYTLGGQNSFAYAPQLNLEANYFIDLVEYGIYAKLAKLKEIDFSSYELSPRNSTDLLSPRNSTDLLSYAYKLQHIKKVTSSFEDFLNSLQYSVIRFMKLIQIYLYRVWCSLPASLILVTTRGFTSFSRAVISTGVNSAQTMPISSLKFKAAL
jgi:hypothetical protein